MSLVLSSVDGALTNGDCSNGRGIVSVVDDAPINTLPFLGVSLDISSKMGSALFDPFVKLCLITIFPKFVIIIFAFW